MKTKLTVKAEIEIILPSLPNFVRTANKDVTMPVSQLTNDQIRELGSCWTAALLEKAEKKRRDEMLKLNKHLGNLDT